MTTLIITFFAAVGAAVLGGITGFVATAYAADHLTSDEGLGVVFAGLVGGVALAVLSGGAVLYMAVL